MLICWCVTYLLTYLLTPWCRVLHEKLTGLKLVKKFPAFHGTWRFITALTSVRKLFLSWASPIQSIYTHPTSWRPVLILSTHLRLGLPSDPFPSGFPTLTLYFPKNTDNFLSSRAAVSFWRRTLLRGVAHILKGLAYFNGVFGFLNLLLRVCHIQQRLRIVFRLNIERVTVLTCH